MEITPKVIQLANWLSRSALKSGQRQSYLEVKETDKTAFNGTRYVSFDEVTDTTNIDTGRACAYSIMYRDWGEHLLMYIGTERNAVIDTFLKFVPDAWERVTDEVILIRNYNQLDGNMLGRIATGIRGPKEHGIDKGFKFMVENGVPEYIAVHLCYIVNIDNGIARFVDSHQMFSYSTASVEMAKIISWVLQGNTFWNNTTERKAGMSPKWRMAEFDGKFRGVPELNAVPQVEIGTGFKKVRGKCGKALVERINAIIQTETIRLNMKKAIKE